MALITLGKRLSFLTTALAVGTAFATAKTPASGGQAADGTVSFESNGATVQLQAVLPNAIRVHVLPAAHKTASARTLVMDPEFKPAAGAGSLTHQGSRYVLRAASIEALWDTTNPNPVLEFEDLQGHTLANALIPAVEAGKPRVVIQHAENENLYGMRGLERQDSGAGILRNGGAEVKAGIQGDGGAPFFFTTRYGVLIDSDGGTFETSDDAVTLTHVSRLDPEFFVIAGTPKQVMSTLATLTGKAPIPPKWTLGFINSQWGATEPELKAIVAEYRAKRLPLDGFILDFDWKAWGQDDYGEWRWNSNAGPGAVEPDKFPDGASGLFARKLAEQGVKLAGILKPRIIVPSPGDPNRMMVGAAYAKAHGFGYPNEVLDTDYVTHHQAMNIDFNNGEARKWFWEHLKPAYDAGMAGWWNDEADYSATTIFSNFQHVNMGRMLYEGQRADGSPSDHRVWSINRNYYLGGLRYGFAEWSGDIQTGYASMALQRKRMLATVNLGEPEWSMDTGGFSGHPSPENYARWMEFSAFVPIFRVHGDHDEKRQPWVYGPVAEAAAKGAMELRYSLMPYLYSTTEEMHRTGIGLVRPMFWEFPEDAKTATMDTEWMFGDALLVSPVVAHGATSQSVYLPAGEWMDYTKGTKYAGGRTIEYPVDSVQWKDIPVFVRAGSIVATQPVQQYVDQAPVNELALDVFPGQRAAAFCVYDDDGRDYSYEGGAFFRQQVTAVMDRSGVKVSFAPPEGSYPTQIKSYRVRVHSGGKVEVGGKQVDTSGRDKFGAYREVVLPVPGAK